MSFKLSRILLLSALIFAGQFCFADAPAYTFTAWEKNKKIELSFTFTGDEFKTGFVQYKNKAGKIDVTRISEEELKQNEGGQSLFQSVWEEKGKTGKYVMVVQGAVIYHFIYIRAKDGKVFVFNTGDEE